MRAGYLMLAVAVIAPSGCAQPSRMRLARHTQSESQGPAWWCVEFDGQVRPPIVGIEIATGRSSTDQWILSDRGVRPFRYHGRRLVSSGPPLPTHGTVEDMDQVRAWLRHALPASAGELPPPAIAAVGNMSDVVALLGRLWPDARIGPPAHLSPRGLANEIEAFPHGVWELLAATKNLRR